MTVEPIPGTAKMRVGVRDVAAKSPEEAEEQARSRVQQLVPPEGYKLSEPETASADGAKA
jgi:hypothetical protein